MGKLSIDELAAILVEKNGLPKEDAQAFVSAIFDVVQTGIERERLVKVKGLGTFKVVDVDARESVNVNTGERVLIDSHSKISFTPDAMMKELVNKPFSSFETVVLNEGVEFDDLPASTDSESVAMQEGGDDSNQTVEDIDMSVGNTESSVNEPESSVDEADLSVEKSVAVAVDEENPQPVMEFIDDENSSDQAFPVSESLIEPEPQVHNVPEPQVDEDSEPQVVGESEFQDVEASDSQSIHESDKKEETMTKTSAFWLLILISMLAGFGIGYVVRDLRDSSALLEKNQTVDTVQTEGVSEIPKESTDSLALETVRSDSTEQIETDEATAQSAISSEKTASSSSESEESKPVPTDVPDYLKYEAMDARVRHGAYYILGTDRIEKVREGDSLEKISRRYLGKDMICYLEVYNGIQASTPLKVGQEIKIPKLITKKAMKEKQNRETKNSYN